MDFQVFTKTKINGQYFGSVYQEIGEFPAAFKTELLINPVSVAKNA